jgi:hypothetical protein
MELSIKLEHFTTKFLHINGQMQNNSFFPINYRTPTLTLNNLLFETPWMDTPFGICQYNNDKDKQEGKYYLDLSFNGYNYDNEIRSFYRVIEGIDNFIINFIENYYSSDKKDNYNYNYNQQLRYNKKNSKYPPTIKLKIFKNNTKIVDIYNQDIDNFCQYIEANSKVQALIRCNGLWFFDNKWGLSWKVCKLSVKKNSLTILPDYPFIENNENNDNNDNNENTDNSSDDL